LKCKRRRLGSFAHGGRRLREQLQFRRQDEGLHGILGDRLLAKFDLCEVICRQNPEWDRLRIPGKQHDIVDMDIRLLRIQRHANVSSKELECVDAGFENRLLKLNFVENRSIKGRNRGIAFDGSVGGSVQSLE
jgi:hypothetical protein